MKDPSESDVVTEKRERVGLSDEELAQQARAGSHEAFAALVEAHQGRMYGLALQMLHDPDEAADAAQEAFVRCYTSLSSFDHRLSFGAWLYRIAYNYCLDVLRRRKHIDGFRSTREENSDPVANMPDPAPGVEDQVTRGEVVDRVKEALWRLSSEHRHILSLRYTTGLSYQEIAQVLRVPESTVTMRLHHAKGSLRRELESTREADHAAP